MSKGASKSHSRHNHRDLTNSSNRLARRDVYHRRLAVELLEDRALLNGVTFITHGNTDNVTGWVEDMATEINIRTNRSATEYTLVVGDSSGTVRVEQLIKDYTPITWGGESIIKVDWSSLALWPIKAVSTVDVGNAIADYFDTHTLDGHSIYESPIHLIGHSRGTSVNSVFAYDLGRRGIWVDQVTTLDPHPVLPNNLDAMVMLWNNVRFADNYTQPSYPWGYDVLGSHLIDFSTEGLPGGDSFDHNDVHSWYFGTIDTSQYAGVPYNWYEGSHGPRDEVGFRWSRIVDDTQPNDGVIIPADGIAKSLGGTGDRPNILDQSYMVWSNVIDPTFDTSNPHVTRGDLLHVTYHYQDVDSNATITFFLDGDKNPYNSNAIQTNERSVQKTTGADPWDDGQWMSTSTAQANTQYYVCVKITDGSHTRYIYAPGHVTIEPLQVSPPLAPSSLHVWAVSSAQMNLTWIRNSTDEDGFSIERKTRYGSWTEVKRVDADVTSYSDTGLLSNTYYWYRVRAYSSQGYSSYSQEEFNVTDEAPPEAAPSELWAETVSNQIVLHWKDNSPNADLFLIERKIGDGGSWSDKASVSNEHITWTDQSADLLPNTRYYYRVRAENGRGYSDYSNEAFVITRDVAPKPPTELRATVSSTIGQINLVWNDQSNNEDGFKIEQKIGINGTWMPLAKVNEDTDQLQITGLSPDTYYYRVKAYNSVGDSDYSNEISATTTVYNEVADHFETGDFSAFPWQHAATGGATHYWTIVQDEKHGGTYSARSGPIDEWAASRISVTLTTEAGNISFCRKVSSEPTNDQLRFEIDGEEQGRWSGDVPWAQVTYAVTTGEHTFSWVYTKEGGSVQSSDAAWLDDIVFPSIVDATPPTALISTPSSPQSGNVTIAYTLTDAESDACSILVQYSPDGGTTWKTATVGAGGDGTTGLTSGPSRASHTFVWASGSDIVDANSSNVMIRITPTDTARGTAGITDAFTVNNYVNKRPSVGVVTPSGIKVGNVTISYSLTDVDSDLCSIQVQYSPDGGTTWKTATAGAGGDGTTGLSASPSGTQHTFVWASRSDIVNTNKSNVKIRITPSDAAVGTTGTTNAFMVNNSAISNVVVTATTSDKKTVIAWNAADSNGITSVKLTIDGKNVSVSRTSGNKYSASYSSRKTLTAGSHSYVITAINGKRVQSTYSGTFKVAATTPTISNIRVKATTSDKKTTITWKAVDVDGIASAALTIDGKTTFSKASSGKTSVYYSSSSIVTAGAHQYAITVIDLAGKQTTTGGKFTVAATVPTISKRLVKAGTSAKATVITWNAADVDRITSVMLTIDNIAKTVVQTSGTSYAGSYSASNILPAGKHIYQITITDAFGVSKKSSGTFYVSLAKSLANAIFSGLSGTAKTDWLADYSSDIIESRYRERDVDAVFAGY